MSILTLGHLEAGSRDDHVGGKGASGPLVLLVYSSFRL